MKILPGFDHHSTQAPDLSWVDEFIKNVKPYIFVRLEDQLLIKRPNSAFKLNPLGSKILYDLLHGGTIKKLLKKAGAHKDIQKQHDILEFMVAVKKQLEGDIDEFDVGPAVEIQPFHMDFSVFPVLSEIAVTYRCNIKCRFCYAGCNCTGSPQPIGQTTEMTNRQIKTVLRKILQEAKVPSVSFTGGEPTLRQDLPGLVKYAKKLGMRVNLITNGLLVDRPMAKRLAAAGLDSAQVSLEGVSAATHDHIVQRPGAFAKTTAAVEYLAQAGILVHTNTTICRLNLSECTQFPRFVKEKLGRDRFSMNLVIPSGSGIVNEEVLIKYSEIKPHLENIIRASEEENIEFMWYSPVPMCMFNSVAHGLGNKGCSACDGLVSVAANGDILPCSSYADSVGNLLKEDFQAIWQSAKAKKYRAKSLAHPMCKECEEFAICNGACPLYWQHQGFEELTGIGKQCAARTPSMSRGEPSLKQRQENG